MINEGDRQARDAAEAVARNSYGRLIAFLAAPTRDLAAAEDALSEAFAAALRDWSAHGVPANPEAWLLTAARRKIIDGVRRRRTVENAAAALRIVADEIDAAASQETHVPDERLALMFACAHPAIESGIRAPLILQTVLGFDAATIGSAFLVSPAAMGQRLSRAKHKIRDAGIPFRVPEQDELAARLDAVLDAIYTAFAQGWCDASGTDSRRRELAGEAIWLGRLVVRLLPQEPEALGLLALMLYAEARHAARRNDAGDYVPLGEQDTATWNSAMIAEAEGLLTRASACGATGRFQWEAAVQSAHAVRRLTGRADWGAIVQLYDGLLCLTDSPVVAINRAIALAEIDGAAAGLAALDALAADSRLAEYQPYWAARAALLAQLGRHAPARDAYRSAIGLESDPALRRFLQRQHDALIG